MRYIFILGLIGGVFLTLALMLLIGAWRSVPVDMYAKQTPAIDFEDYFDGPIKAWGLVQDRRGKVMQRFDVDLVGTWNGDTGTLAEKFDYYDGTSDTRTWTLVKQEDGTYQGTAGDVVGPASGETAGFAANWRYTLQLPLGGRVVNVVLDDWMYLMRDDILINVSDIKKFGVTVARLVLFMQKQPGDAPAIKAFLSEE